MSTLFRSQLNEGLERIAQDLDISPSKYQQAVERYTRVATYLEEGEGYPGFPTPPALCCQGSFRLGTVVRPYKDGRDADYDIDLVCQFATQKAAANCSMVKQWVGDRLKASGTYRPMLKAEGRRCWTLEYAEQDGIGFHMDVLPCVAEDESFKAELIRHGINPSIASYAIAITDKSKDSQVCSWTSSNPEGFARWFGFVQRGAFQQVAASQKRVLLEAHRDLFESIEAVPDQLVRTPLQRAVQLLKRHRDVRFAGRRDEKYKPISMVLNCMAALSYGGEADTVSTIEAIVRELADFEPLLESKAPRGLRQHAGQIITRLPDGRWYVPNPVNPMENFADRWHEDDNAKAKAFFQWVEWVRADVLEATRRASIDESVDVLAAGFGRTRVEAAFASYTNGRNRPRPAVPHVVIADPPKPWRHD